jgi:hypothetical protein
MTVVYIRQDGDVLGKYFEVYSVMGLDLEFISNLG